MEKKPENKGKQNLKTPKELLIKTQDYSKTTILYRIDLIKIAFYC